jgi:hypothetical protein
MLFGKYPFDGIIKKLNCLGEKDSEINNKIMKEPHKFPNNIIISKKCQTLIDGLLEKIMEIRIDINSPLFEDWFNDTEYYK